MEKSITVENATKEISSALGRNIYQASLRRFLEIFNINYWKFIIPDKKYEHWRSGLKLKPELNNVIKSNLQLFDDFDKDFYSSKTFEDIAKKFKLKDIEVKSTYEQLFNEHRLIDQFNLSFYSNSFTNLKYVSSYQILYEVKKELPKLRYEAIKDNLIFDEKPIHIKPKVFADIFDNIVEELEPIFDASSVGEWGLQKPGGILLYGPPGCGKTYWAQRIANITEFELKEIPRSLFGSTYVDGAMQNLIKLLEEIKKKKNIILFFDEFDSIASDRSSGSLSDFENSKVVNTLLQEIPKLINKNIILVAATNFIDKLDPAVIRPGRFDLKIPVFPPLPDERIELLVNFLFKDLSPNSIPIKLFKKNSANTISFWSKYKEFLNLYSTSLIKDLANVIRRNTKKVYKEIGDELIIDEKFILNSIKITNSKLSSKDVEYYAQFYNEIEKIDFAETFLNRRFQLKKELEKYSRETILRQHLFPLALEFLMFNLILKLHLISQLSCKIF